MELPLEKNKTIRKVSVFVVDDSLVYRNLLRNTFSQDGEIEFLGAAIDGKFALPKIAQLKPDFVILDVEMPQMNGIQTLEEIKSKFPETKVIMLSSLTQDGAKITLKALEMGAIDFVPKPNGGQELALSETLELLTSKIKALSQVKPSVQTSFQTKNPAVKTIQSLSEKNCTICAIGISTGGPIALRQLFSKLSPDLTGSIVIAQHMPPLFTNYLAESLSQAAHMPIKEAEDGEVLKKGVAYIAPGGKQLQIINGVSGPTTRVFNGPEEELCKPSVNILFRSLAENFPKETTAIIMTGMGEDGYLGMKELKKNGAYLIAQNRESCTVFGMPNRPVQEGLVDEVLDVERIAEKISSLLQRTQS
ncbi:chemotaxis response regulator protein-glutamate methylesterase [Leptospira selangorensis]|uniref:Protein-glutamate methylesterase/protein-glutamine glutaminase n=1 Tax=Leptospira selangorensis TaxID=2484982 RepID=A0A5F2C6Q5_9LEPT|nr:chemotaxis response regulator protein-glutamate methylesterase [Leptospira selangorensis]TGM12723.1 chemotaxis response regulator protein-glutamate methylesterase [Leptospira selangorensis]TGM30784.1 chemotaxis response regulator protein-glutamate methylesterase [Leptospira selangorensis]